MIVQLKRLTSGDEAILRNIAADVFDVDIQPNLVVEYLNDPRHHLIVALDENLVVGFASGFQYLHPDKPPQLFINEVGVGLAYQRQGIGRRLIEELLKLAKELGCREAWVATEAGNTAARGLYSATGGDEDEERCVVYSYRIQH